MTSRWQDPQQMGPDEEMLTRIVGLHCDQATTQLEALLQLHQMQIGEKLDSILESIDRVHNQVPKLAPAWDTGDNERTLPHVMMGTCNSPSKPAGDTAALSKEGCAPAPAFIPAVAVSGLQENGHAQGGYQSHQTTPRPSELTPTPTPRETLPPVNERGTSRRVTGGTTSRELAGSSSNLTEASMIYGFHRKEYLPGKRRNTKKWMRPKGSTMPRWTRVQRPSEETDEEKKARVKAFGKNATTKESLSQGPLTIQGRFRRAVLHPSFELFFACMICSNAAFLGWQAEYTASNQTTSVPGFFFIIQVVYGLMFLAELIFRIIAEGREFLNGPNTSWNCLDVVIVITSVSEVAVELAFRAIRGGGDGAFGLNNLRVVRILRIVRIVRVVRVAKLLRFIHALRTFVYSILATLKALIWAMILLLLIIYVFGIAMTQACGDYRMDSGPDDPYANGVLLNYWGNLWKSMFTLFKCIAGGLSWDDVVHDMYKVGWIWVGVFTSYIVFVYFAVLNVVTGIFCQSAIETAQQNEDLAIQIQMANKQVYKTRLNKVFKDIDDDESGRITLDELQEHLDDEQMQLVFTSLDIAPDDAWVLFKLLDQDDSNEIALDEFVDGLMRWRGNAKRTDVVELTAQVKKIMKTQAHTVDVLERLLHQPRHLSGGEKKSSILGLPIMDRNDSNGGSRRQLQSEVLA